MKGDHVGEFEELVLLAVAALGDEAYGVSIKERLDRETRRDISIGAVYAALDRLEAKTLLESRDTPGPAARGGRRRRSFATTPAGRKILRDVRALRERLWRAAPARAR
ncbi:MAG TPA: helix-turn-helix transcriptional regulator [Vicinamibacterales bacterium]|jgi:DNA-binding PadR family transcriptional regulator